MNKISITKYFNNVTLHSLFFFIKVVVVAIIAANYRCNLYCIQRLVKIEEIRGEQKKNLGPRDQSLYAFGLAWPALNLGMGQPRFA